LFVLKPDEIGDFILTTGCLRVLAREIGEDNLLLAVSKAVAPLARSQFPAAKVFPLEFRRRRKVLNITLVNIGLNWRVWRQLLREKVEWAICLRSLRSYLQTVFFYTPRARHYIACENLLGRQKRQRRPAVEAVVKAIFRPQLLRYPEVGATPGVPTDLAANREVVSAVLGRQLSLEEIWPTLRAEAVSPAGSPSWVLAPFSSSEKKDYPLEQWIAVLRELQGWRGDSPLQLTAAGYQQKTLERWGEALRGAGLPKVEVLPPVPLESYPNLLAGAGMVLTVDTAAAHFACALRRPALILSAGHHPGVYGPYSPDGRQLWLEAGQSGVVWTEDLSVERVVGEFRQFFVGRAIAES
jgi:ADP-heptose:LPS heptosyltransferase